jgi:hypothetical protein
MTPSRAVSNRLAGPNASGLLSGHGKEQGGRPSDLDDIKPETIELVLDAIRAGNYYVAACAKGAHQVRHLLELDA